MAGWLPHAAETEREREREGDPDTDETVKGALKLQGFFFSNL